MENQVLVINYHKVVAGPQPEKELFSITATAFQQQMEIIRRHRVSVVSLHDLHGGNLPPGFSVAITVDDGNASDHEIVCPLLKALGLPATFFWLVEAAPDTNRWLHAAEMLRNGFAIGSHGLSHRSFFKLSPGEQLVELMDSKQRIEAATGQQVRFFAFPYGSYMPRALDLARQAGYQAVCCTDVKLNRAGEFLIHRWNVKRNTSPEEFEAMVCNTAFLQRKIKSAQLRRFFKRILGEKAAYLLSSFVNR